MNEDLHIAEIPWESGTVRYRYTRYLSESKEKWIRHGLFRAYHENGVLASEGNYEHGSEHGSWKDYHDNGVLAAMGYYEHGSKLENWKYWDDAGNIEEQAAE